MSEEQTGDQPKDAPRGHYDAIRLYHDHSRETLRQYAHARGLRVDGWHMEQPGLEDTFVAMVTRPVSL